MPRAPEFAGHFCDFNRAEVPKFAVKLPRMNSIRLVPLGLVLVSASCAQSQPSGPRVIQVPQHGGGASPVIAARPATSFGAKVKLFDAYEHQWQGTGTAQTHAASLRREGQKRFLLDVGTDDRCRRFAARLQSRVQPWTR